MTPHRAGHAAVIGGGMAGILAAQALGDHFAEVTVVERDKLPNQPHFRKGVPQARHLHTLWAGGLRAVERLLPGIEADLIAAGACPVGFPRDVRWLTPVDRWMGRFPATQRLASASRILIEWVVRRRVEQTPGIRFITGHEVRSIRLDRHGDVGGLTVCARGDGTTFELLADLVVDASGRGSALPDWLEALDRSRPQGSTVDAFLGYASRTYAIPDDFHADWKSTYIQAAPPRETRGGIMMPIEDNRWIVTLLGGGRDYPPTDDAGFLQFARSLRSGALYDVIAEAEPTSPVWGFRHTSNHRRHYERLRDMPGRLLVVGDSLCTFNPLYGQGMTVAALQAETLTAFLHRHLGDRAELPALVRPAQRAIAKCTAGAWLVATGSDLRYPVTSGAQATFATRLLHRHLDRVFTAATGDPSVNAAFLRVLNMVDAPEALFRPGTMARALLASHRWTADGAKQAGRVDHGRPRHLPGR
jgi:2-polyprenyl-6-methoxyphenol hydroxylase-like FAD-dependent oxidoreductase